GKRLDVAVNQRDVSLAGATLLELLPQSPMRCFVFGAYHDARGVPVQSMHDAGAGMLSADLRERAAAGMLQMPGKSVDDGPGLVPPCWVHDDVVVFVDDNDVPILMKDANRDLLGRQFVAWWRR
ncbi:MAG: hypothetical protein QF723_04700, partial [Phycisphaerales bacterium]|nr:hypothetical protein [Phycisphaerales bacterium]